MPLELVYPQDMLEGVLKEVKPPVVLTEVFVHHSSVCIVLPSCSYYRLCVLLCLAIFVMPKGASRVVLL